MVYRIRAADTYQTKDAPDKLLFFRISTCDAGHFVGEVALLQIFKMSRQPLPPWRQGAVVPGLSFALEKQKCFRVQSSLR